MEKLSFRRDSEGQGRVRAHLEEQLCCQRSRVPFQHNPHRLQDCFSLQPQEEVEQAARYLIGQAREEGIRWRDMAVAVSDLTLYEELLTEVFSDCGIPFSWISPALSIGIP